MSNPEDNEAQQALDEVTHILRESRNKPSPETEIIPQTQEQASVLEAQQVFREAKNGAQSEEQQATIPENAKAMRKMAADFIRVARKAERSWRSEQKTFSNRAFRANPKTENNYTHEGSSYDMRISEGDMAHDMLSYEVFARENGVPTIHTAMRFFDRPRLTLLDLFTYKPFGYNRKTISSEDPLIGDPLIAIDIFHTKAMLDLLKKDDDALSEMCNRSPEGVPAGIRTLNELNAPVATFLISSKGIRKTVHIPNDIESKKGQNLTPGAPNYQTLPSQISSSDVLLLQRVLVANQRPIGL